MHRHLSSGDQAVLAAGFIAHTTRTPTTRAAYLSSLEEVGRRGYAVSIEEFEVGLSSVAAPILLTNGDDGPIAVAAISVAGPTPRVNGRGSVVAGRKNRARTHFFLEKQTSLLICLDSSRKTTRQART